jgi:hypothetical protein
MVKDLKKSKQHDSKRGPQRGVTRKSAALRALEANPAPGAAHQ